VFDHTNVVPVVMVLDAGVYPLSNILMSPGGAGAGGSVVVVVDGGTVVVGVEPPPLVTVTDPVMSGWRVQKYE